MSQNILPCLWVKLNTHLAMQVQMHISGAHISDFLPLKKLPRVIEFSYTVVHVYFNGLVYFNVFSTWVLSTKKHRFHIFFIFSKAYGLLKT